ncbi:MAG TPA: hypothetical protein VGH86_04595 [Phenylobacterium sp.]
MEAEAAGAAPVGVASRVLEGQERLIAADLQHRRWQIASEQAGFALKMLTAAAGVAAAVGFGLMVWDASRANGLVVAGFSAPPPYAARGLSGEVLGNDLTNRIAALARFTNANSLTHSGDVRADGGESVKVEIPQTGVSLGELARYLRGWLGHERRLTAALRDDGGGMVSITLAIAGEDPVVVRGAAGDLDALMNSAAEKGFALFDSENGLIYLITIGRQKEMFAAAEHLVHVARTHQESARAYAYWSLSDPDRVRALAKAQLSIRTDPAMGSGWFEAMNTSVQLGHDEAGLAYARGLQKTRPQDQGRGHAGMLALAHVQSKFLLGEYIEPDEVVAAIGGGASNILAFGYSAVAKAAGHDTAGAERQLGFAQVTGGLPPNLAEEARWAAAAGAGDWPRALATARALAQLADSVPADTPLFSQLHETRLPRAYRPWLALAEAQTGDIATAQALAALGPLDCYLCLRVRARVAEAAGDRAAADRWFAEAVRQGPSLPFAHLEWGQAKLARGDVAGAIGAVSKAHALSPRFVDALEAWGEALAARDDAQSAADKYAEAARIAPKWGRLQLKWGEALAKLGKTDDAKAKWRAAAEMDLSAPDRVRVQALLAKQTA